jgi:hypothetical protein
MDFIAKKADNETSEKQSSLELTIKSCGIHLECKLTKYAPVK